MIPDPHLYLRIATLRERIARALLLFQLARDDAAIADLLTFSRSLGDETEADSVTAFRAAQAEALRAAQAELNRLTGPDEAQP